MNIPKKFFKKLNEYTGFISSIITITLLFTDVYKLIKIILSIIVLIYILLMIAYIIWTIFSTDKAKIKLYNSFNSKNKILAQKLHSYNHNLRNYVSSICSKNKLSTDDVTNISINICNYIAEFYKELFKDYLENFDVNVCLKTVKPRTLFDSDSNNWEMETIARNTSTSEKRKKIDNILIKISENTDFQVIISDKYDDDLFAIADMSNIYTDFPSTYNNLEYRNSRKNFLDYYKSTIVVPIKIEGKYTPQYIKNRINNPNNKNFILGFLCIDSLKTFITPQESDIFSLGIEYAKSFGDSLYLFFEKVLLLGLNCNTIPYNNTKTKYKISKNNRR